MLSCIHTQNLADKIAVIDCGYWQIEKTVSCSDDGSECFKEDTISETLAQLIQKSQEEECL